MARDDRLVAGDDRSLVDVSRAGLTLEQPTPAEPEVEYDPRKINWRQGRQGIYIPPMLALAGMAFFSFVWVVFTTVAEAVVRD